MRLLFIALEPPYPPHDGGRIRTYNLLKAIGEKHEVTLLAFEDSDVKGDDRAVLDKICDKVYFVPRTDPGSRTAWKKVRNLGRLTPVGLDNYASVAMQKAIENLLADVRFDLVHVDQLNLAQYRRFFNSLPAVLTHHNIEALAQRRELRHLSDRYRPKWWFYWLEYIRWLRYETVISRQFQALAVVSKPEADYFTTKVPGVPIFVVPNGVDTEFFTPKQNKSQSTTLLYTGRMDYSPNVDAMIWFCNEIMPLVQSSYPQVTLKIVGRDPVPEVMELSQAANVIVTGAVPDIRPFYDESLIYIVPLRQGGGTRLKILEAMAMEMPIVTTHIGLEGLAVHPGEDIVVADTPDAFALEIERLIEDGEARQLLGVTARQNVLRSYDWREVAKEQEKVYQAAVGRNIMGRNYVK